MDDFPSNARTRIITNKTTTVKQEVTEEPKKIEKITTGEVIRRKKPLGKRLFETFFGGDAKTVISFVVMEVLVPAAKDAVADAVSQGVERTLFGEVRSSSRRAGSRPSSGYISYNRFSTPSTKSREEPREISRRSRAHHEFDEIYLATRAEAEEALDRMYDLISKYEQATVADLYDLLGISSEYTDDKWGWTDLHGAGVIYSRKGYLLDLPKPEPLR